MATSEEGRPAGGGGQGGEGREAPAAPASDAARARELLEVLSGYRGRRLAVVIRGFPDPDSLACAWAHQRLARAAGTSCEIVHFDAISRPENRAMVKALDVPISRLSDPRGVEEYEGLCMVDASALPLLTRTRAPPCVSVVDHHRASSKVDARFAWIDESVGAASTLYARLLAAGPAPLREDEDESRRLATALAYGIRTDTDDLLTASREDLLAMADLAPLVDPDLLGMLSDQAVSAAAMDIIRRALAAVRIEGTFAYAGVGYVRTEDRDGIGLAADFLLRREGIDTTLVFGIVSGTFIDGSFRTGSPTVDPGAWLKEAFGNDPAGGPYGGGRKHKGGFQIPLAAFAGGPDPEMLWELTRRTVEFRIRQRLGVDAPPQGGAPAA